MRRSLNRAACGRMIGMCGYTAVPEDGRTCFYITTRYVTFGDVTWYVIYLPAVVGNDSPASESWFPSLDSWSAFHEDPKTHRKQDAVGEGRLRPRCRHLTNSTKQRCCLTSDWFRHLANWTKYTPRLWFRPIRFIMRKHDVIRKTGGR